MRQDMQWEVLPSRRPILIPMLEDLSVLFVQHLEGGFDILLEEDRQELEEWTDVALIQQAFRNLKEQLGEGLELATLENGLTRVVAGGNLEASFLLLSNLWMQLEADYGEHMYAAIPCHNLLVIGKQSDRNAILNLQAIIRDIFFEADRETLLSKAVYQRFEGEWNIIATAF